ncbi:cytochrome P450 [Clathrospora elynae]|uniref:Cytochrome P450 monooxygenase ABA1 n=1 Tax=Clathrospora elynae TaxID=706981 RepID=A0A6A5S611_9PLEO|nr:cytochrome P450 [Clathrospora elynae]
MDDFGQLSIRVLSTSLLAYVAYVAWQWHRLSHIPGPFWASLSKFWMVKQSLNKRQPLAFKEMTDKYGTLVRVGPNDLVTDDPEVLRRMMAVRSDYTRGHFYNAMKFEPGKDNLFSMRDEVAHMTLRNKMAAGYSGKENESMEGTIDAQIAGLVDLIQAKYLSTPEHVIPMDIGHKTQYFTLDVISALAFGRPFGYLTKDEDVFDYIKITETYIPIMLTLSNVPWLADLLHSRFLRGLLPKESDKLGFGAFIGVAKAVVQDRFANASKPQPDMLGSFIRNGLTADEACGESLLQVIAGSDTSATTIRAVMLYLIKNPSMYSKIQAEIDQGILTGAISSPIKDSEARNMPYLQAAIKEGLRILPPAPNGMFKQVPPQGDVISGTFIPGGTQIGSCALGIHHSKKIFGPDADSFRPERWLEADAARVAEMTNTVDLVFHYGKYQCLGKNVAWMEFNKVFVELLRVFDFALVQPDKEVKISNGGLWVVEDFWVKVTRRGL